MVAAAVERHEFGWARETMGGPRGGGAGRRQDWGSYTGRALCTTNPAKTLDWAYLWVARPGRNCGRRRCSRLKASQPVTSVFALRKISLQKLPFTMKFWIKSENVTWTAMMNMPFNNCSLIFIKVPTSMSYTKKVI
jgi:hypothetical protein